MSLTYGFYNSINNDRKYDAVQMSSMFDGIIRDGVFASIGTGLMVTADTGSTVKVGVGKAWFNHTWTLNDATLLLTCDEPDLLLDRIDAIVLEVDARNEVRKNSIKFVKGSASRTPARPTMTNANSVHQYPLCYIYRTASSTEIAQEDITNTVGTSECPFVTGILDVLTIDDIIVQWRAQFEAWMSAGETEYNEWYAMMRDALAENANELDVWMDAKRTEINIWFEDIKSSLSGDAIAGLQLQIGTLSNLTTSNKTDLVSAINEIASMMGQMDLETASVPSFTTASSLATIVSGERLSAAFGKIAKAITDLINHVRTSATASVWGHVKLSDTYATQESNAAAANGIGASQNALYNAYNDVLTKMDARIVPISKADYDALGSEKLSNNVIYFVSNSTSE